MKFILNSSLIFALVCYFIILNIKAKNSYSQNSTTNNIPSQIKSDTLFGRHLEFLSDGFDFPVGYPDSKGYYNAQKFKENNHLGEDWNAVTGGNSDLGHPIFAISNGWVSRSYDAGPGWGNIIRIIHKKDSKWIESLYAHCKDRSVNKGDWVKRGDTIATIGNANGAYLAHLHFEIRDDCSLKLGPGYSTNTQGYMSPTEFIKANRPNN